jgi:signal transduction histidine kinase
MTQAPTYEIIMTTADSRKDNSTDTQESASVPLQVSRRDRHRSVIVSAAADGIVVVDHRGIILMCNPAASELLGHSEEQLVGQPFGHPIMVTEPTELELALPDGGHRVVEVRATTTVMEEATVYVAALRDITQRRQDEQALHSALDEQTTAVAVAAHQLDNPLSAICLMVHRLRVGRTSLSEEEQARILDFIAESTEHLQTLLHRYTTVTRIDAQGAHPTAGALPLLDAILQRLSVFGEHSHDVCLNCDRDLAVLTDPVDFSEMLGNYLDNALSYGRPPFEISVTKRGEAADVRVVDHGPGVPESFTNRLFERFSRAATDGQGSGLGLWIVRHLARAHGGDAWYEPRPGGGSCFCLRLRLARTEEDETGRHRP